MEEKRRGSRFEHRPTCIRNAAPKVPPLPKLHSRGPLVTTKLSKPIFKSTAGHDFDLSRPIEDEPFREYNPLHDPHTRAFFHRPSTCLKLQRNGFVTANLRVVCALKEYNAYREFMESESMKMGKRQEEKQEREKQALEKAVVKEKVVSEIDKEREKRGKKFFKEQEKKLARRQRHIRRIQLQEQQERLTAAHEKKLMQERNEIRLEAEREQRHLSKLQQEHQEALEQRRQLRTSENQILVRMLQLQHSRQSHRLQQIKKLESKWQAYDDHVQKAREEEEEEKAHAKREKERKRLKREKIVQLMRAKKEARSRQLHEQACQLAGELKKQADENEKLWQERKEYQVTAWRERIHREQEHWQHHMQQKLEICHTQHQKEMEEILHHSYLPNCAKTTGGPLSKLAGKSSAVSLLHLHNRQTVVAQQKRSRDGIRPQQRKKSVRFQETASIHIIEEDELGLESEAPPTLMTAPTASNATSGGDESEKRDEGAGEKVEGALKESLVQSNGEDGEERQGKQGEGENKKEEEEGEEKKEKEGREERQGKEGEGQKEEEEGEEGEKNDGGEEMKREEEGTQDGVSLHHVSTGLTNVKTAETTQQSK